MDTLGEATPLRPGELAPAFELEDELGNMRSLSAGLTNGPLVLVFYRGDW